MNTPTMTPLDSIFVSSQEEEADESEFYNLFFNTNLYVPTHALSEQEDHSEATGGESISPVFIESNGAQYLMLFDSKNRLSTWAQEEVSHIVLSGYTVLETMPNNIHWALNVDTDYVKIFTPDEIKWLKNIVAQSEDTNTT